MSLPYRVKHENVDALVRQQLWLPGHKPVFQSYIIAGGQSLVAGAVLGMVTTTKLLKLTASAAGDGSEVPFCILGENLATYDENGNALDMSMAVAVHGYVNINALTWGAGHTADSIKIGLRNKGIFADAPYYSPV